VYADVPFHARLRGSLDGITPEECSNLLTGRRRYRKGVLTHVSLHSKLERRYAGSGGEVKKELKSAGFSKELILANVKRLRKLIAGLEWSSPGSTWSGYELTTAYSSEDAERKAAFVAAALATARPRKVWDLGCNEGRHARIAADTAETVVALDADALVIERLYRALEQERRRNILPLVGNLVDPSPSLGWRGLERRTLEARGTPDLALALALIHHVVIGGNVPVAEFLDWLRSLDCALVLEFPGRDDPLVRRLLDRKRAGDHPDYERELFERARAARFQIDRTEELAEGARVLYLARTKS
jgi:SAM-dependent methyltransferase